MYRILYVTLLFHSAIHFRFLLFYIRDIITDQNSSALGEEIINAASVVAHFTTSLRTNFLFVFYQSPSFPFL